MNTTEKVFVKGLYFDLPSEKAPEFIKGKLSVKVADFIQFMNENQNVAGYVNIDLKVGVNGKAYAELNTWKPKVETAEEVEQKVLESAPSVEEIEQGINIEDIPF